MVRTVDHGSRKNRVLAATVDSYVCQGEPVSSNELSDAFDLSSATIRNILAELEQEGYLWHPHTSAGRVPSTKGYRYYVDFLMGGGELPEEEKLSIRGGYSQDSSLDEILERTSDLLAEVTHYASIVSFADSGNRIFYKGLSNIIQQPEFHDFERFSLVVRLLEERKKITELINQEFDQPLKVYIGEEIGDPQIGQSCSLVVSTYTRGKKNKGKIAVLGPCRMSYRKTLSALEYVSSLLNEMLEDL